MASLLEQKVFTTNNANFEKTVWEVYQFQSKNCAVYSKYLALLGILGKKLNSISQIPFLPISFFKSHDVITEGLAIEKTFTSSGTTGSVPSKHLVHSLAVYKQSFMAGFNQFYGSPNKYCILALLPSYLEREGSSLVYMAGELIQQSNHPKSGFYLDDFEKLAQVLAENEKLGQKTLLLGVSFALLDFGALFPMQLNHTTIMETGGMKGRRRELTRSELHNELKQAFGVTTIHSEYGMTELLSQAYAKEEGRFYCPPTMQAWARVTDDPFSYETNGKTGGLNIIDLANIYSCSFIETEDLGRTYPDGSFEVLGRFDNSETRGCNTMVG